MIRAYDRIYRDEAQRKLGLMLDYAVNDRHYELTEFFSFFLGSGLADRFGDGDPSVIAGRSGIELAYDTLALTGLKYQYVPARHKEERSREYWTGWALAYYQWYTGVSFNEIERRIPIEDIRRLYSPYHEMDIRQFGGKMDELYVAAQPETNLQWLRQRAGVSQSRLADESGVPVKTIQQYEQRRRCINRAQAAHVFALAKALHCKPVLLMERPPKSFFRAKV